MNYLNSYKMGCLSSNEMPLNEAKKTDNDDKKIIQKKMNYLIKKRKIMII